MPCPDQSELEAPLIRCAACGAVIVDDAVVCRACGADLTADYAAEYRPAPDRASRWVAWGLLVFLAAILLLSAWMLMMGRGATSAVSPQVHVAPAAVPSR